MIWKEVFQICNRGQIYTNSLKKITRIRLETSFIYGLSFGIFDTVGLNEGEQGRVPHWKGIQGLYTSHPSTRWREPAHLLHASLEGEGKCTGELDFVQQGHCGDATGEKVPIIAVLTGLEGEDDLDDWWRNEENRRTLGR